VPILLVMELTPSQARAVAIIRSRNPGATLRLHERPWGYILEVTSPAPSGRTRTIGLARFEADGAIVPDERVRLAA
jgi:hypothetical protein